MKVDEAKEYISSIVDTYEICHDAEHTSVAVSIGAEDAKALEMAIASLEEWEKVRQEMEDYKYMPVHDLLFTLYRHLEEVQDADSN